MTDLVDEFLAHNGIAHFGTKGMKWGIRRQRDSGSGDSGGEKSGESDASSGSGSSDGASSGSSKDGTHMSVDAERFIKTHMKQGHEMSDREIKEAVNRANMTKQYNDIFNKPNSKLQNKVDQMKLNKEYAQMKAEMNPSKTKKVLGFTKDLSTAFEHYQKINSATGGAIGKRVEFQFSQKPAAKIARALELSSTKNYNDTQSLGKQMDFLTSKTPSLLSSGSKSVSSSKSLLDEVADFLETGPDNTVQGTLF